MNIETIKKRKKVTKSEDLFQNSFKKEEWFHEKLTTSTITKTSTLITAITDNTSSLATSNSTKSTASITLLNEKVTNDILKIGACKRKPNKKKLPNS
jgi:hypothetical protein